MFLIIYYLLAELDLEIKFVSEKMYLILFLKNLQNLGPAGLF